MDELKSWVESKVAGSQDPEHPPKLCANFWLCEWWFTHEQGTLYSTNSKLTEEMQRDAQDLSSGMCVLGLEGGEPSKKKQKLSPAERHKSQLGRATTMVNRLSKAIAQADGALPSLKRAAAGPVLFGKFKSGLEQCRQTKEKLLDQLEDLKTLARNELEIELQIDSLKEIFTASSEHLEALNEGKKSLQPAQPEEPSAIKDEAEQPPSQNDVAEDAGADAGSDDGTSSQK